MVGPRRREGLGLERVHASDDGPEKEDSNSSVRNTSISCPPSPPRVLRHEEIVFACLITRCKSRLDADRGEAEKSTDAE